MTTPRTASATRRTRAALGACAPVPFEEVRAKSEERLGKITAELGLAHGTRGASDLSVAARGATHQNVLKPMKDIRFEQAVSGECGVTMNDSVEARAIAEFMAERPGAAVTHQPALVRIDGHGKLVFKMDEISECLGREMTASTFEANTSTHHGRMVRVDGNPVVLLGNMDEVPQCV